MDKKRFLADRRELVKQAKKAFVKHMPNLSTCNLLERGEDKPTDRAIFSTYPTIMNAINDEKTDDGQKLFTPGHFDLIIVDEAHRSIFKKYRAIFEYFDALLVGLTATPKKDVGHNTYDFFDLEDDMPTYAYEYDQARDEGWLVDYHTIEKLYKIPTEGINYDDLTDEQKEEYEDSFEEGEEMPDFIGSTDIDTIVFNKNTTRRILSELMEKSIKVEGGDKLGKRNCGILIISESGSLNGIGNHYTGCITVGTHFQTIPDLCYVWITVPFNNTAGFLDVDIRSLVDFNMCIRLTIDFIFMMSFAEYTGNTDGKPHSVLWTTGEIFRRTQAFRDRHRDDPKEARRSLIRIPVAAPLKIPDTDLPVDPYLYGYWLGNGNAIKPEITVRDEDVADIISFIPYQLHNRYPQKCGGSEVLNYTELKPILLKSFRDKAIRAEYLRASEEQRWALLQGLMDSDGCVGERKGQSIYVTTIRELAETVRELLWSLGIKNAVKAEPSTRCGWPTGEILYVIRFTTFSDQPTTRLVRKAVRQRIRMKQTRSNFHYLESIEAVDHPVQMQCIQVDSPSHQYLAGKSMVPTHNSELAAAVALYLLYADNEPSAEVYGAAADRQQASIVFDVARQMVDMTPALVKRSKIMTAGKRIVNYQNAGYYQVLSAEVGTKHGLNVSGLVFDELHSQPNRQLYDVLTKGSGDAREQPLYFLITTAGTDRESICYEVHMKALDILQGKKIDPSFYPVVYGLPDDADWNDEANWYKANPSLGYTIKIDRVRAAYKDALENPAEENVFRQLRLDQWVGSLVAWIPEHVYDKGDIPIDMEKLKGRDCYAGLDLSSTSDTAAIRS